MVHTKYSHYTLDELLRFVDGKRHHNPVINELCKRIEELQNGSVEIAPDSGHAVECPVCAAELRADYDDSSQLFTLELKG